MNMRLLFIFLMFIENLSANSSNADWMYRGFQSNVHSSSKSISSAREWMYRDVLKYLHLRRVKKGFCSPTDSIYFDIEGELNTDGLQAKREFPPNNQTWYRLGTQEYKNNEIIIYVALAGVNSQERTVCIGDYLVFHYKKIRKGIYKRVKVTTDGI